MKNNKVRPITDLRNTNEISNQCHESNEHIFITKNGYDDLVIMSNETYNSINKIEKNSQSFPILSSCYGLIKVVCVSNEIKVACPSENSKKIIEIIKIQSNDLDILVFPELAITG